LAQGHSKQVPWLARYTSWLAFVACCLALGACGGGDDDGGNDASADTQTISFQEPEDPGEDPFTPPADVEGDTTIEASQPFGGSGSNRVCDRDKLIKFLEQNPERMREWARVLALEPRIEVVKKYIARLHPVTLTRDTQVTNHAYTNGQAVPFQAILQAGTAVLVDKYGVPVVRCYCGNPLGPAIFTPQAECSGCPPDYKPPKGCEFNRRQSYDQTIYSRSYYSNGDYDEVFISQSSSGGYSDCYKAYPDPPVVTAVPAYRPPPTPEPAPLPEPEPEPAPAPTPAPEPTGLQCDPPRSQLEAEQCAELQGNAPEPAPEPTPPPPTDICNDGLDNEGEPGLIDGDDPNCQ
jgi:uncharacterized protein DUF6777